MQPRAPRLHKNFDHFKYSLRVNKKIFEVNNNKDVKLFTPRLNKLESKRLCIETKRLVSPTTKFTPTVKGVKTSLKNEFAFFQTQLRLFGPAQYDKLKDFIQVQKQEGKFVVVCPRPP